MSQAHSTLRESRCAIVQSLNASSSRGILCYGSFRFPCALGRSGRRAVKREGDGATPVGTWPIREIYYRADRVSRPHSRLPTRVMRPDMAWCDVANDRNYNRRVTIPYRVVDERLWRDDNVYDLIAVLGYNDAPRVRGLGSAIFMHMAREGYTPTAGCVALSLDHLYRLLTAPHTPTAVSIAA